MVHRKILVCALALTLFGSQFITVEMSAQTFRGGINGSVTDSTGAVLPQALVTATNEATALTYKTNSSGAGVFSFQDLPPGSYLIEITASGFQKTQFKSVVVLAGKIHTLDGKLHVATQPSTVEVSAAAVALDTTTVSDDTLLSTQTVQDIPINGRDFTQLVDQSAAFSGYMAVGSVNGTRSTGINWQIEGADNNDSWGNMVSVNQVGVGGIAGVLLPLDSVDEFSLQSLGAAETGRNPGGTLNLAIKSGTNQFHGTAYYYNRNEFFAAQSPFAPPSLHKNALRNQHYGFSIGGPIRKDKTFFFLNLEEQKYLIGNQSRSTEPSEAYQAEAEGLLQQFNVPLNPVSVSLLNGLWPASALSGPAAPANYFNPNASNGYSHNGLLKLDHSFNEDNRVSFRVFLGQGNQTAPNSTHLSPYREVVPSHMQNYDAIYNRVISSRFTNQLVAGVNYFLQTFVD
ncbi:MAG TPA: carboxypeptidase-like regulatory domain-containing protein, partial [Candidatus Acidoferrum sp.]|nr:carboxypeptidase-like regulatory domain-containing protein [Candidatus Acidoferrum sp.]